MIADESARARETPRIRARRATIAEILAVAKTQIAADGASSLSLRAIARELNMTSSAIYRYFTSRDELLTDLLVDVYNELGEAVEQADATAVQQSALDRWRLVCSTIRTWARKNPTSYALLFGSPVPGYEAPPERTVPPATRTTTVFLLILADGHARGDIELGPSRSGVKVVDAELTRLRGEVAPGLPMMIVGRAVAAWMSVFGLVSFEVFGQTHNVLNDHDAFFRFATDELARSIGFRVPRR